MSLALLFHYLMLNMFRMLIHPSSGTCDLFVELFHGLYCSGSMCVDVRLWFGCGGVVSVCRLRHYSLNPLTPNDHYSGRTAPLTSKRCILYIYSTNTGAEYFKHGVYSPIFVSSKCSLFHNSNLFGSCFIHILYTGCAII